MALLVTSSGDFLNVTKSHVCGLKIQPCKLYNKKYMIGWTQIEIRNAEIFASKPVLIFKFNGKNYR